MAKNISKCCILLLSFIAFSKSYSQDKKVNNTTQLWSEVDLLGQINKKWKWQCDVQYSRQSPYESLAFLKYNETFNVRPWLHYYPKSNIKLSAFVGYWYNYAIADNVSQRAYPEYRTALQAQFYHIKGLNKFSNRFRTELREIKDKEGIFETVIRGRYMLKYQRLLSHKTYDKNSSYAILQDEIFVNGGSNTTGYKLFDQNRFFAGYGYNVTDDIAIEAGYFNQFYHHAHDTNFDFNNILQVSLIIDNITKL